MAINNPAACIGSGVASVLEGSWRRSPPKLDFPEPGLGEVADLLAASMSGALAWCRIRNTDLASSALAATLRESYLSHTIGSALREHAIKKVLTALQAAEVDAVLVKGWAISRLYPEPGLRPFGDIDLAVRPEHLPLATETVSNVDVPYWVDLHHGFDGLDYTGFHELWARSMVVKLDDVGVRILRAEDHLRVLCFHLLRHNAFRPLWLCDIGAAVEYRSADFDWNLCLGRDRRRADWVACSIALAHELLAANVDDTPGAARTTNLPRWLISSVLKEWATPYAMSQAPVTHQAPMAKYLRDPRGLLADLRRRWPKPIEATVYVNGAFNRIPRWPYQMAASIKRTTKFAARLPGIVRKGR